MEVKETMDRSDGYEACWCHSKVEAFKSFFAASYLLCADAVSSYERDERDERDPERDPERWIIEIFCNNLQFQSNHTSPIYLHFYQQICNFDQTMTNPSTTNIEQERMLQEQTTTSESTTTTTTKSNIKQEGMPLEQTTINPSTITTAPSTTTTTPSTITTTSKSNIKQERMRLEQCVQNCIDHEDVCDHETKITEGCAQMFSCPQACKIRRLGIDEQSCRWDFDKWLKMKDDSFLT